MVAVYPVLAVITNPCFFAFFAMNHHGFIVGAVPRSRPSSSTMEAKLRPLNLRTVTWWYAQTIPRIVGSGFKYTGMKYEHLP